MNAPTCMHRSRGQRGVSLIEVLVAIFVLSLGVLAMAGLQLSSMRTSQGALLRSQAATLATDMADRMRANLTGAATYVIGETDADPTGTTIRDVDLRDWRMRVRALPNGRSSVAFNDPVATIRVVWDDRRAGGGADEALELVVRLRN